MKYVETNGVPNNLLLTDSYLSNRQCRGRKKTRQIGLLLMVLKFLDDRNRK